MAPAAAAAAAAAVAAEGVGEEIREVRLPSGWEGLSIKLNRASQLVVSEVPKACFSSAAFGASGAKPQVDGVSEGDEIATFNGEAPLKVVERITSQGDAWNACSSVSPPHAVGSKGKFDSPPCVACDFIRRRKALGLDVALQMWLRAVKRDIRITLGVRPGPFPLDGGDTAGAAPGEAVKSSSTGGQLKGATGEKSSIVDLAASSSVGGAIAELKSLDDHNDAARKERQKDGQKGKGKGKGKKGKGKGKGKTKPKRPTGPDLPRTRLSTEKVSGEAVEWKGKYGWIRPAQAVDHALAGKHKGKLYIHSQDLIAADDLKPGITCWFHIFSDASGLGAEECIAEGDWDGDGDEDWEDWGEGGGEWSDEDWQRWEQEESSDWNTSEGREAGAAGGNGQDSEVFQ